jgi:hypothetical protein
MKLATLFIFLVSASVSAHADKKSCLPGDWHLVSSIEGYFSPSKVAKPEHVELWEQSENEDPEAKKENHAALVLGDCEAVRVGFRATDHVQLPYASSALSKVSIHDQLDLIQVISSYAHGFSEETTQLYSLSSKGKVAAFSEAWSSVTLEGAPNGVVNKSTISFEDLNHDGYADVTLKAPGKDDQHWYWNSKTRVFEHSPK